MDGKMKQPRRISFVVGVEHNGLVEPNVLVWDGFLFLVNVTFQLQFFFFFKVSHTKHPNCSSYSIHYSQFLQYLLSPPDPLFFPFPTE